eukprot:13218854-Heterocapsa_arctica.AAC.1
MGYPDKPNVKENGQLKGRDQGSDRAEVRALVAALEKTTRGVVHKGKHSDLWKRIKEKLDKRISIRWVKAHLKVEKAAAAGVPHEDWFGNDQADKQAKEGAEKHGYTEAQKQTSQDKV